MDAKTLNADCNVPFVGEMRRPHFTDDRVNVVQLCRSFKEEVAKEINNGLRQMNPETVLSVSMEMSEDAVNEVSKICSVDELTCENEPQQLTNHQKQQPVAPVISGKSLGKRVRAAKRGSWMDPAAVQKLCTLQAQKRRLAEWERNSLASQSSHYHHRLRYRTEFRLHLVHRPLSWGLFSMRSFTTLQPVVVVRVYQPSPPPHQALTGVSQQHVIRFSQEITCLGSNMLTQLRDCISCPNDETVTSECHVTPRHRQPDDKTPAAKAKDAYRSGFFCIDRTFYIDRRQPGAQDYSEPIRKWANQHRDFCNLELTTAAMETTSLSQLSARLGYPYIYVHQGRCQHLMCISDVRLMHPRDAARRALYPIVTAVRHSERVQLCYACDRSHSRWVTLGHELSPTDPTYFCEECFFAFNFNNAQSRGPNASFKAYPCFRDNDIKITN